jgi:hypothetical protein
MVGGVQQLQELFSMATGFIVKQILKLNYSGDLKTKEQLWLREFSGTLPQHWVVDSYEGGS